MNTSRPFTLLAAVIFLAMAVIHVYRLATGFQLIAGSHVMPMAVSWIATVLIAVDRWADWSVAGLAGAPVAFVRVLPAIAFGALAFPLAAMIVSRADRWRWGR